MKKIILSVLPILICGSASAQGLIGTGASVFESSFCKHWGCVFEGKSVDKSGVESFSYSLGSKDALPRLFRQYNTQDYEGKWIYEKYGIQKFKVFRKNGVLVSAVIYFGGQDNNLAGFEGVYSLRTRAVAELISALTGSNIGPESAIKYESACRQAREGETLGYRPSPIKISLNSKAYLTCQAEMQPYSWIWNMWIKSTR